MIRVKPTKHDVSSFIVQRKETPKMNDNRRNLQDTMMSFAHWGGMLVDTKQMNAAHGRLAHHLTAFVPQMVKRQRA